MNRFIMALVISLAASTALADLRPPPRTLQPISDPAMVVMDRGAKLEVLPTKRATQTVDSTGVKVVHRVTAASASTPIGPSQLGVVYNHAMQAQGYITGEIAFQVKGGHPFTGPSTLYPGLKQIKAHGVYVVNARTPGEFIKVLKRLQARSDMEWVEPTVEYGPAASGPVAGNMP